MVVVVEKKIAVEYSIVEYSIETLSSRNRRDPDTVRMLDAAVVEVAVAFRMVHRTVDS